MAQISSMVGGGGFWTRRCQMAFFPTCQITRSGFAGIGPKSIALGRSLQAADSFVGYCDDGSGTVALQKL